MNIPDIDYSKAPDSTSRDDVNAFADMIVKISPGEPRCHFLAALFASGLMKIPWYLRLPIVLGRFRTRRRFKGVSKLTRTHLVWFAILKNMEEEAVDALIDATVQHIQTGIDFTNEGVGGFNQSELNLAYSFLKTFGVGIAKSGEHE